MMMSSLKYLSSTFLLILTFAFASAQNTHVKLAHYDEDEIVNAKMDKNEAKYPVEKAKGNAKKYNKL